MKIVIDNAIPYIKGILEPYADVRYLVGSDIKSCDLKDCQAMIIRTRTKCDKELLEGSAVRFIASATIGSDHIDTDYCKQHDIEVALSCGCNSDAVAQWVLAAVLECDKTTVIHPSNTTIGIIGVGNVGGTVANLFSELGFRLLLNDPPRALIDPDFISTDLNYLLSNSDIITLHTPLTDHGDYPTDELLSVNEFEKMKRGVIFINASRGEVVKESALIQALEKGVVSQALLDVYVNEPMINGHLVALAKVATPHIAGYSINGKANGTSMAVRAFAEKFEIDSLKKWYPDGVEKVIDPVEMSFSNLKRLMPLFYSISDDSRALKEDIHKFESLRNHYRYRKEFF